MSVAHAIAARTNKQDNPACQTYELTAVEAEWLEWHNRTSGQPVDNVVIKVVQPKKPRPSVPGTPEQHATWIHEYDGTGDVLADVIRASRYRAIFGTWPDGTTGLPAIPKGVSHSKVQWLKGQSNWSKFLKWLGEVDPAAYEEYIERHYTGRKWDVASNGLPSTDNAEQDPIEQEVNEGMRRLKLKRLRHSLCVDASELRVWFQDNIGSADDVAWLTNYQKLKAISEQIAELDADDFLSVVANQPAEGRRRQRARHFRLSWIGQKLAPELPDDRSTLPGTTLAERIQARRERRQRMTDDNEMAITLTEKAEAYFADQDGRAA